MPITGGTYQVPNNFVQQYDLGQKKIRADLVDQNFSDAAEVINQLLDDDKNTVHKSETETITGNKTFSGNTTFSGSTTFTGNMNISAIVPQLTAQLKVEILKSVFPVGALYTTTTNQNPATTFGFGTWSKIEGRMIIGASSGYAVNSTGGEATHKLTVNEMPAHTHTRGTMNITGSFGGGFQMWNASGAFTVKSGNGEDGGGTVSNNGANFDASRNWTGATSSVGGGASHNNMPPYYAAYIWRRTA